MHAGKVTQQRSAGSFRIQTALVSITESKSTRTMSVGANGLRWHGNLSHMADLCHNPDGIYHPICSLYVFCAERKAAKVRHEAALSSLTATYHQSKSVLCAQLKLDIKGTFCFTGL